jgi:DNA sulfur modification protein DndB
VLQVPCFTVTQGSRSFILTRFPASFVTSISYAAVRGKDEEEGAIQRALNSARISSIRDFALNGGSFPSALILNWVEGSSPPVEESGLLSVEEVHRSAQIIDGQHRIAGIEAAIRDRPSIGGLQLPVALYTGLSTQECADIFLSINTEHLFGVASTEFVDHVALRARDVAMFLHESENSPYNGQIKLPGSAQRKGGIALSTVVTAIKPLVDDQAVFAIYSLVELETQKRVILNLFGALRKSLRENWDQKDNVFLYASGFAAAIRFLQVKMMPYCAEHANFTEDFMSGAIDFDTSSIVNQRDLKGLGGVDSVNRVYESMVSAFKISASETKQIQL